MRRRGLNTVAVEGFYRRGLLNKFLDSKEPDSPLEKTAGFRFGRHFAGIFFDANKLELSRWNYSIPSPSLAPGSTSMDRVESILKERAESLGVTILRSIGVASIVAQDDNSVTVETANHDTFRGRTFCFLRHPNPIERSDHLPVGRILLAGDTAHIHPPLGAQGLNCGLADAMNIGWKVASTIRQEHGLEGAKPDLTLLDTYHNKRHPAGEGVLEFSRAQVAILQPAPLGAASQQLIRDLIATTDGTNILIDRFWGLSLRYKPGNAEAHAHPLVGSSAPDFELVGGSRLGSKFSGGRGFFIDFEENTKLEELVTGLRYEARVDYIAINAKDTRGLHALLVRPDGFVAWMAEGNDLDLETAKVALEQWFSF
ncbi:hypothetical protein BT63DRAFT_416950 [Microthyrium microscopicum]|uniref:FAD-binding domain-containing protein n=1 Tax=Microthyrium microscopicum TaxID=703497 RepID=A0A6A6TZ81_9PEZI|nr:hypothetical protein BT63DRAFT_416950 [Microthyrium microscopicum]